MDPPAAVRWVLLLAPLVGARHHGMAPWVEVLTELLLPPPMARLLLHLRLPLRAGPGAAPPPGGQLVAAVPPGPQPAGQVPAAALPDCCCATCWAQGAACSARQQLPLQPVFRPRAPLLPGACRRHHLPHRPAACCPGGQALLQAADRPRRPRPALAPYQGSQRRPPAGRPGPRSQSFSALAAASGGAEAGWWRGSCLPGAARATQDGRARGSGAHQSEARCAASTVFRPS